VLGQDSVRILQSEESVILLKCREEKRREDVRENEMGTEKHRIEEMRTIKRNCAVREI
jgi:hypothetical protein